MDLGATPLKTFFVITLPVIAPALVGGWLLAFHPFAGRPGDRQLHHRAGCDHLADADLQPGSARRHAGDQRDLDGADRTRDARRSRRNHEVDSSCAASVAVLITGFALAAHSQNLDAAAQEEFAAPTGVSSAHTQGVFSARFPWPIIVHAVLLPNGRVFSYGTDERGRQGGQFVYDVWIQSKGGVHRRTWCC